MRLGFKKGILTYLGAIFLMSYIISNNVSAFDFTSEFNSYEYVYATTRVNMNCTVNGVSTTNQSFCVLDSGSYITELRSYPTFNVKSGDVIKFSLVVFSPGLGSSSGNVTFINNQVSNMRMLGFREVTQDDVTYNTAMNYVDSTTYSMSGSTYFARVYEYYVYAPNDIDNYSLGLLSTNAVNYPLFYSSANDIRFKIVDVSQWRYVGTPDQRNEEEKTQEAADASEAEAEDNSESQQTDSIINVFGSFVSAVSSLQPTNCNVTLQWPASLGGNMTVNVCQNKDKAGSIISVFGSITLLVFYIPLALKLLSMIYNEIRSFTNG